MKKSQSFHLLYIYSTCIYQGVLLLWFLTLAAFSIFPSTFLQRGEMEEVKLALAVPETVTHEVRPFRTAIIAFQVLKDAAIKKTNVIKAIKARTKFLNRNLPQEECVHSHGVN